MPVTTSGVPLLHRYGLRCSAVGNCWATDHEPACTTPPLSCQRRSAVRRVRYVETSHLERGDCILCQLDELAQGEHDPAENYRAELTDSSKLPVPSSP